MRNINNLPQSMLLAIHPLKVLLPLLLLISATPSFAAGLTIQYELVARTSETPVPGGGGTFLGFGSAPAIDNNGNVALVASSGLNGVTSQVGVYTFIDGAHQMVADLDTLIPGGGGASFSGFNWDAVDIDGGRVAFRSDFSTITGIYSNVGRATANDLVELVRIGDGEWSGGGDPWVDGGIVAISGTRLVPQQHYTMARINGSSLSANFVDPGTGYNVSTNAQASISGGATIFTRYNSNAAQMGIKSNGNFETLATVSSTASNSSPMPGLDGARFSAFYKYPLVDRDGLDAAFMGWGSQREGLFKRVDGGALQNVVDNTKVIPDSGGDVFQIFSGSRYSLANRQVVFWGSGQSFLKGIYTDIGGGLSVIVDNESNNTIEIDGQTEQIIEIDLGTKSLTYTPQGYMVVFLAYLQSGGSAIIRATIDTGATIPEPDITISGSGAFGDVEIGTSSTHTITISNAGNANLVMGTLSGLASPFSIVSNGCNGTTIAPAGSCTMGVRFAPTTTGSRSDTLVIPSNDPDESTSYLSVSGNGTDSSTGTTPDISVSGNVNFGDVETGTSSTNIFTISNVGDANLLIGTLRGLAAPFTIVSNGCSGATVAPAQSCTVGVRFAPTSTGLKYDTLIIPSNDPDQATAYFSVNGTGTDSGTGTAPDISVSGNGAFGNVEVGTNSTRTVTISNVGNANLVMGTLSGLASPFSIVSNGCNGVTIAPAASCTVGVRFAPSTTGSRSDTLNIPSNDPDEASVGFGVSGTGTTAAVPDISVSGNGAFGNVEVGTNSTRTVTISNVGNANLVMGTLSGLASPFSIVSNGCNGVTIAPAASCTVGVRFAPSTTGSRSDTLNIPSNDPDEASVGFGVSGTGTTAAVPDIAVSGNGNFGNVEIGSNTTRNVTVSNAGNANLVMGTLSGLASPFSIVSNGCNGVTIAPAASCTVGVRFAPTTTGSRSDTLNIPSNDPDEATVGFAVSGNGTDSNTGTTPDISVSGNVNFGDVETGTNNTNTVTISNVGDANLVIGTLRGLAAPFTIVSDGCSGATVAAAQSCTVGVRFAPTSTGLKYDTLIIPSNDPDRATAYFSVNGTGTGNGTGTAPDISVSGNGAFGNVEVGTNSTRTVTISNAGNANLVMGTLSGLASPFAIVSNGCNGVTIAPAASCTVVVRFAPTTTGSRSDTLNIPSNDPDEASVGFAVSGTGTTAAAPDISVSGNGAFGDVEVDTSSTRSVTISNVGSADLVIGNLTGLAAPFTVISNNCGSVAPSGSCVVNIRFSPLAALPYSDTLFIASNDPDEASVGFGVTGNGTEAPGQEEIILEEDFEDGNSNGWSLDGSISIDAILAIGNYSLRHTKAGTSVLQMSTTGYRDVNITMHIAATSMDNGEACYAEVSIDDGSSWITVAQILNGNDDGTFISGTVSPASAEDNPGLQLRFRSTGGKKPDYCYGDHVIVSGTLN